MSRCALIFFALCFLGAWAASELPPLETTVTTLEPFTTIRDCLPFNVRVAPSKEEVYSLTVEAEGPLLNAVRARVKNGELSLGLKRGFETERVIKVTVTVPRKALEGITKSATSVLVVAPGLNVDRLSVETDGQAAVRIFDGRIDNLDVTSNGGSIVFAEGKIKNAKLNAEGTARVYCYGLRKRAEIFADDIGRIYLDPKKADTEINGQLDGIGRVFTTKGDCSVTGVTPSTVLF